MVEIKSNRQPAEGTKTSRKKARLVSFGLALVALLLAYAAASWAIDSGRLLSYFLTMVLVVLGVRFTVKGFRGEKR